MASLAASPLRPLALIIDDDPDTREMYALHLQHSGMDVEAGDGADAVALAQTFLPDVITTDVGWRDFSGPALCPRLKHSKETKHIPVIVVTASAMPHQVAAAFAAGCSSVLLKPCLPDTLLSEIRRVLRLVDMP